MAKVKRSELKEMCVTELIALGYVNFVENDCGYYNQFGDYVKGSDVTFYDYKTYILKHEFYEWCKLPEQEELDEKDLNIRTMLLEFLEPLCVF